MPKVCNIKDVKLGCASSNTRYGQRNDALVITLGEESVVSGKFTANSFKAAPIKVAIENFKTPLKGKKVLLINAGNANAATGSQGLKDVKDYCKKIGSLLGVKSSNVIPFSTGVIGEALPSKQYLSAFINAISQLDEKNWKPAALSILTTDTKPKLISKEIKIGKKKVAITGFAKGSGMIKPDFATLLSFVFVDAKLNSSSLKRIHSKALEKSLNLLKVKGKIITVSFHSLEDRLVKDFFNRNSGKRWRSSRHYPELADDGPITLKLITKKPIRPSDLETKINPRSRSAKLRVAEKISIN